MATRCSKARISSRLARFLAHRPRTVASLQALAGAGVLVCTPVLAQKALPVNTLPQQATQWVERATGSATYNVDVVRNAATVKLGGNSTILRWNSMDVGANASLNFVMPSATSRVLNKVDGGFNNMTTIDGMLRSNGQVYIYNSNGILFGKNARVDVNALVATSLRIDEQRFWDGLLSPNNAPNFALDPTLRTLPGAVIVEGSLEGGVLQQAAITAQKNGFILLVAPQVTNSGALSAPDGQVLLAAGSKVYLAAPVDNSMRGFLVEVGSDGLKELAGKAVTPSVTNTAQGAITVQRGNITLAGLAVNQSGLASATTSVNLNGSIYLQARDGAVKTGDTGAPKATHGGELVLGENSRTEVLPTIADSKTGETYNYQRWVNEGKLVSETTGKVLSDVEAAAVVEASGKSADYLQSIIDLSGKSINLKSGAGVLATGGKVTLTARADPSQVAIAKNDTSIDIAAGAVIDVSGATGTSLAMDSNVVTAELRGGELADNVLLKNNSAIRGQTVRIDRRIAKNGVAVANVSGYLSQVESKVGEFAAGGGSATLVSEGDIRFAANAKINVSGGWIDYASGYVNTTKLTLGGRLYDFETASASLSYDGLFNPGNSSSNFEVGYREGSSAGSVQFDAPNIALKGNLLGQVTLGDRQRNQTAADRPLGGQLLIGNVLGALDASGKFSFASPETFHLTQKLVLGGNEDDGAINLDINNLAGQGFSRISAVTQDSIVVNSDLKMSSGGQFRLGAAGSLDWKGNLAMAGGDVVLSAQNGMKIADGTTFDLAGNWQNDIPYVNQARNADGLPNGRFALAGGSLRLYANRLTLGNNVGVDVSGGGWVDRKGVLTAGDAGSITVQAVPLVKSLDAGLHLGSGLALSGYGLSKGGTLSLTGRNVDIFGGDQPSLASDADGNLRVSDKFFAVGGFASQSLTANGNLSVLSGASVLPRAMSWSLLDNYKYVSSGRMSAAATPLLLPLVGPTGQRQSASLSLRATGRSVLGDGLGLLSVARGASIENDPAASLTLAADRQIYVDGTLAAPAGTLSLFLLGADISDNAYNDRQSIWLGSHARLSALGSTDRLYVDPATGLASGEVLDGGTIRIGRLGANGLEAAVGYVIAETGSLMDVSGVSKKGLQFKSGGYVSGPLSVSSSGGTIDIRAREGMVLAGEMKGAAGGANAHGGKLTIALDREAEAGGVGFPQAVRSLEITAVAPESLLPAGLQAGEEIKGLEARGRVAIGSFAAGGFGTLKFRSENELLLAGAGVGGAGLLSLAASGSIEMYAPNFRAASNKTQVNVAAPYVAFGNSDVRYQANALTALGGDASLNINASLIDLMGNSALQGFGQTTFRAVDDIRLVGSPSQDGYGAPGALAVAGVLKLQAAQVYPTTLSSFSLSVAGDESVLDISSSGAIAQDVLSAGGSLSAKAAHIVQRGRLLAPFGSIALEADKDIVFESGSVTSVAGSGIVPFGSVVNGVDWTYDLAGQSLIWSVNPSTDSTLGEFSLPVKQISAKAPNVIHRAGALLDLSGGGSLYAYEFTPGPGGSVDVLQSSGISNQSFAINVNSRGAFAPLDWQYGSDGLKVGDRVYLSGGPGLPAGYYTLLPAHYALLPGGFAIEPASKTRDMSALSNRANADSSLTIAGYRSSALDGVQDSRSTGFTVTPYDLIRRRSEFTDYTADSFFSAQASRMGVNAPMLPADGGNLTFDVTRTLNLDGLTRLSGSTGSSGNVDIAAPSIMVVANQSDVTGDYVKLLADDLNALGAGSLLLGGKRRQASDGVHLEVLADVIGINNTAAHSLTGAEFIFAASDTVQLSGRSSVVVNKPASVTAQKLIVDGPADGALLRASAGPAVEVQRGTPAGAHGLLDVGQGAQLVAGSSLFLDATRAMNFGADFKLNANGALAVHAPSILLGSEAPAQPGAITFASAGVSWLSRLATLDLSSYGGIDLYGKVSLGGSALKQMTLAASEIRGHNADVQISVDQLNLAGSASGSVASATADTGGNNLHIQAKTLNIGAGNLHVSGFANTTLAASGEILATGDQGTIVVDNNALLSAARVGTAAGKRARFNAGGNLVLAANGSVAGLGEAALGGTLIFQGKTLSSSAVIVAPSGSISLLGAEGVAISAGELDVHGGAVAFGSGVVSAPAGNISIDGGKGSVLLGSASLLDLSAVGAAAGALTISATGSSNSTAVFDGAIQGASAADQTQGSFSLDVARGMTANEFDALGRKLNSAGFSESRSVRVRSGDIEQGSSGLVQAQHIMLVADDGDVRLAGTLDASAAAGGSIEVYGAQGNSAGTKGRVQLASTARLLARANEAVSSAAGSTGDGGRIVLGVSTADGSLANATNGGASLRVDSGAVLDVSGAGAGQGGTVTLRAPRVGSGAGTEVAIDRFLATVTGSRSTQIEAVKVYAAQSISERQDSASNLNAGEFGRMATDAGKFMLNSGAILGRLGRSDLALTSGIEVRSAGDLSVSVNENALDAQDRGWNLNAWRFGGQAGSLTLRAAGNLNILGSISDGFVKSGGTTNALPNWALDSSEHSWNLRLIGGSDTVAANPLAVKASSLTGDVSVNFARSTVIAGDVQVDAPVALVRTGTGRIDLSAGRDVVLGTATLVFDIEDPSQNEKLGAAIYTAGHSIPPSNGFSVPVNLSNSYYGVATPTAAAFGAGGGAIVIDAQRDVVGAPVPQLVNNWLFRQGRSGLDASGQRVFETLSAANGGTTLGTAWWARFDYFGTGIATFGGGDVSVIARSGSVRDVSANVASNAYLAGKTPTVAGLVEQGGGNLLVKAGGDILGGSYYVQKGKAQLSAAASIKAGTLAVQDPSLPENDDGTQPTTALRPVFALGDGTLSVTAGKDLQIENVYNPTLAPQSIYNVVSAKEGQAQSAYGSLDPYSAFFNFSNTTASALADKAKYAQYSSFSTYSAATSVKILSLTGDAMLSGALSLVANSGGGLQPAVSWRADYSALFGYWPSTLKVAALGGSVTSSNGFALAPSALGQLEVFARDNIAFRNSGGSPFQSMVMLDNDPAAMTSSLAPTLLVKDDLRLMQNGLLSLVAHTPGQLHADDEQPVRVVALSGDIVGDAKTAVSLSLPKFAEISAGRDIRDLGFNIQHNRATDETQVLAGRDFIDTTNVSASSPVKHWLTGAGLLTLNAGRDIDLGNGDGVVTRGNLDNAYLPEGGAAIIALAGSIPTKDWLAQGITDKLAGNKVLFEDLVSYGNLADIDKFDAAIAKAFSDDSVLGGNINVFGSQIKTEQGGSLDLLAPGGSVVAGLVSVPDYLREKVTKHAAENGIFTVRGGAIRSLVHDNFVVNQGRVFSLGGGDITLVSQYGNIDAGRGTKTASSAPPPLLTTDANGNTKIDISSSISGSGIATLRTSDNQAASNVYAVAPRGTFDAGDAGVRSTGTVAVQAAVVLNAGNIQASGGVSGAATVTAGAAPAAASSSNNSSASQDAAKQLAMAPKETMSLSVEVLGYGESDGAATNEDDNQNRKKRGSPTPN